MHSSTPRIPTRSLVLVVVLAALIASGLIASPVAAVTETDDTIGIVKEGVAPSNAEIAVRLSEGTPLADTSTVVVARDDAFADALASGLLQHDHPMLLVPSTGPIPDRVAGELDRLAPERVIILGGTAAVGADVEQQLQDRGFATERRAGLSRFETATTIAATEAPEATTAIMARAFPASGSTDETQAFADTLGVGAWAAEEGWPVVLTETERLTPSTREFLLASEIATIQLIGGTAAISDDVQTELVDLGFDVVRVAGTDRFGTAIEVAKMRGADSAADVAQVLVVDSQFANSWAGGLAAASHSAFFDAPIVLTSGTTVPASTMEFLAPGTNGQSDTPLTCVAFPDACEQARVAAGLPAAAEVTSDTPDGAVVTPGQSVTVAIDPQGRGVADVRASGSCLAAPETFDGAPTTVTVTLADPLPQPSCELRIDFTVLGSAGFAQTQALGQAEILTFTTVVPTVGGGIAIVPSGGALDARQLASNLVGDDVQVINATLTGASAAAGLFAGGSDILGFDQGIVMSTGQVTDVVGPNDADDTTGFSGTPGDPDLTALAGQETFEAVVLEFDFVADADRVRFDYVFGSEEYEEFVGSDFNDVFAFFVNGVNCATVGGGPVSVNTINSGTNAEFFRPNPFSFDTPSPLDIEFDGLTTTLPCESAIIRNGTNRLKLAIADASDEILDSGVFIRAASFQIS